MGDGQELDMKPFPLNFDDFDQGFQLITEEGEIGVRKDDVVQWVIEWMKHVKRNKWTDLGGQYFSDGESNCVLQVLIKMFGITANDIHYSNEYS